MIMFLCSVSVPFCWPLFNKYPCYVQNLLATAVLRKMKNKEYKDNFLFIYCFLFPASGIETWCLMVSQEFERSRL